MSTANSRGEVVRESSSARECPSGNSRDKSRVPRASLRAKAVVVALTSCRRVLVPLSCCVRPLFFASSSDSGCSVIRVKDSFASELSALLSARRKSLRQLRDQLASNGVSVSLATLSYWRSGQRLPEGDRSWEVIAAIERVFGLADGYLTGLVHASRKPRHTIRFGKPTESDELERERLEVIEKLGVETVPPVHILTLSIAFDFNEDRRLASFNTRLFGQVAHGTVDSFLILQTTENGDPRPPELTALGGGEIVATAGHQNGNVFGGVFELDVPTAAPDTFIIEWQTYFPADHRRLTGIGFGVHSRAREVLAWTRFASHDYPDFLEVLMQPEGLPLDSKVEYLRGPGHAFQRRNFGPGHAMLRWYYDH